MKTWVGKLVFTLLFSLLTHNALATTYDLPPSDHAIIGQVQYGTANHGDNAINMAQRFDLGFNAIENANPDLDLTRGFNAGTKLKIPTQHLLPNEARKGIIINLPEMRMYYFPKDSSKIYTYPIGIGKMGKTIPITRAAITRKATNPTWTPPDSIREFNLEQGIVLPQVMPPGPDNPLGQYAIYMSIPTYLIHSTIFPASIGKRASFGCIRMYESDIEEFFPTVNRGVPVAVINQPVKIGWQYDHLYLETHQPLEEHEGATEATLPGVVQALTDSTQHQAVLIDWQLVSYLVQEKDGLPHEIGIKIPD